jgi:hypothetical protein
MQTSVTGTLDGTANVATMASYGVKEAPHVDSFTTYQGVALAAGSPNHEDVTEALAGNSQLRSALLSKGYVLVPPPQGISDCYSFVIGALGGKYNANGRRTETINSQIAFTLNTPFPSPPGNLYVGLYNIKCYSFQSLTLTITKGSTSQSNTYYNCSSFLSALNNTKIDLLALPSSGTLPVKISISEVLTPTKGQGAYFNVLFIDPVTSASPPSSGNAFIDQSGTGQKTQNNVGVTSSDALAHRSTEASLAIAEFGPGLIVLGCSLLAIMMTARWRMQQKSR